MAYIALTPAALAPTAAVTVGALETAAASAVLAASSSVTTQTYQLLWVNNAPLSELQIISPAQIRRRRLAAWHRTAIWPQSATLAASTTLTAAGVPYQTDAPTIAASSAITTK